MLPLNLKKPPVVRLPPKSGFEVAMSRGAQVSLIVLGLLGLVFALHSAKFVLAPVGLAIVVGLMLGPLAGRLERIGMSPWLSSAVVFLLFIFAVFALALALSGPLTFWIGQAPEIWEELQFQLYQLRRPMEAISGLRDEIRSVTGSSGFTVAVEEGSPVEDMAYLAPAILAQVLLFVASLYFYVATRHQTRAAVLSLCVGRRLRWRVAHVFRDVEALVSRYLLSISLINAGLGVAVSLALWAVGVPSPALWGALAGLLNFIMYVGPAVMVAILFAIGLATFDTLGGALLPPLVYLSINLVEGQAVTPAVLGRTLTLNPFLVLIALAFWIWLWGPVGGFIAIPALLIVFAIIRNIVPGADLTMPVR
jgi:predicted PurR-regulated permease PerM